MDHLEFILIIYVIACSALLLSFWALPDLKEIKSNVRYLMQENRQLKQRVEAMERTMMKNGYRPPHKK
jgi:type II secretory pathway component PulJ